MVFTDPDEAAAARDLEGLPGVACRFGDVYGLPPVTARLRRLLISRRELVRLHAEGILLRLAFGNRPSGLQDATAPAPPPGPGPRFVLIEACLPREIGLPSRADRAPFDDDEREATRERSRGATTDGGDARSDDPFLVDR